MAKNGSEPVDSTCANCGKEFSAVPDCTGHADGQSEMPIAQQLSTNRKTVILWHQRRCGTMTHDYKRNGTTALFAALEVLQGKVIGQCHQRHRHQEFLKFLCTLDQEFPGEVALHLVIYNYGTHKHEKVRNWLKRCFVLHFVPTSSSWLNLVERCTATDECGL
jgi:hypothetical protein